MHQASCERWRRTSPVPVEAGRSFTTKTFPMYTFQQFKALPAELQLDELGLNGVSLDLDCNLQGSEAVLFAYSDFYVELVVAKHTDDILCVNCFRGLDMLEPYLDQIDISEINPLLLCSR
jgi:hypothetical protein